ncbi:hypothetical protein Tco_0961985, partial [Tanacetum coccineum]
KLGLWYLKDSPFDLVAYTDSDYAGASLDKKSTTGDLLTKAFDSFVLLVILNTAEFLLLVILNTVRTSKEKFEPILVLLAWSQTIRGSTIAFALVDGKKIIVFEACGEDAI